MSDSLTIEPRVGLGIACVMARKGIDGAAIGKVLGVDLPAGPRAIFAGPRTVVGTSPGTWLVIEENAAPFFADGVQDALADLASVSDQSSGYAVQRLSGAGARILLQRGAAIDLHPLAFGVGAAATTVIAHIGVVLWQTDARPSYDVAIFRSYAGSFRRWLDHGAAAL